MRGGNKGGIGDGDGDGTRNGEQEKDESPTKGLQWWGQQSSLMKGDNQQPSQPSLMKGKAPISHEFNIDFQLEDVSPKHRGSSLQLSISNEDFIAAPI